MNKEELMIVCRNEIVMEKTFLLWHEEEYGFPPMCGGVIGNWFWNSNLETLYDYYQKNILRYNIYKLCEYKDYANDDKELLDIMNKYEIDYDSRILDIESYQALKAIISNLPSKITYDKFDSLVECINTLSEKLVVACSSQLFSSPENAINLVMEHDDSLIEEYESVTDIFKNDYVER